MLAYKRKLCLCVVERSHRPLYGGMTLCATVVDHLFCELSFVKVLMAGFAPEIRKMEQLFLLTGLLVAF
jgi:hypothetical protein